MLEIKVILIGGTGRCGTNILKETLSLHDEVFSLPFENRYLTDPDGIIDTYTTLKTTWTPYIVDNKIDRLMNLFSYMIENPEENPYRGWELEKWFPNIEKRLEELYSNLIDFQYVSSFDGKKIGISYFVSIEKRKKLDEIFNKFLMNNIKDILEKHDKTIFVDDNTWNTLFCKEMNEILPNAKFINISRKKKDVISSMKEQRWTPSEDEQLRLYFDSLKLKIEESISEVSSDKIYKQEFERLVDNPKDNLKELCEFIGMEYQDKLLDGDLNEDDAHIGRGKE